LKDNTKFLI